MKKQQSRLKEFPTPTEEQFLALNGAFQYFNRKLFGGKLPGCILNFSRKKNTHGFMAPGRWRRVGETRHSVHEISLTPTTFYRKPILVFSTLVHEQAHLWQWEFGSPSRNGYHNKEWAAKMIEIGLIPTDTGRPGGKQTGQKMTHLIASGGKYEKAFNSMPKKYLLPFTSLEGDVFRLISEPPNGIGKDEEEEKSKSRKSGKKVKYSCSRCRINVWGKPELNVKCGKCDEKMNPNE